MSSKNKIKNDIENDIEKILVESLLNEDGNRIMLSKNEKLGIANALDECITLVSQQTNQNKSEIRSILLEILNERKKKEDK